MAKTPRDIVVKIDTEAIAVAVQQVKAVMAELDHRMKLMTLSVDTFGLSAAQVEGKFYVRGGLDPRFAAPADRDAYLRLLLKGPGPDAAAAFLCGWAAHRGTDSKPFAWHRLISNVAVEVSAS